MSRAVFFDVDGTLVSCQTQKKLSEVMWHAGILHLGHVFQILLWSVGYRLCFFKETVELRRKFYRFFARKSKAQIDSLILEAYETCVRPFLRKSFLPLITDYKKQGYLIFAVSGTLQQFCDLIKNEFGMNDAFGTTLCVKDGFYDGRWFGSILEGANKAKFILKLSQEHGVDLKNSICYADSFADIPSLELFGKAIAVAPDRRLMRTARERNWGIFRERIS